jgi:hypothetical protein
LVGGRASKGEEKAVKEEKEIEYEEEQQGGRTARRKIFGE